MLTKVQILEARAAEYNLKTAAPHTAYNQVVRRAVSRTLHENGRGSFGPLEAYAHSNFSRYCIIDT